MATKYLLSWKVDSQGRGRWRRMYRGKWFSFPGGTNKKASYAAAMEAFQAWKLKIDNQNPSAAQRAELAKANRAIAVARLPVDFARVTEVMSLDDAYNLALEELKQELRKKPDSAESRSLYHFLELRQAAGLSPTEPDPIGKARQIVDIAPDDSGTEPTGPAPWDDEVVAKRLKAKISDFLDFQTNECSIGRLNQLRLKLDHFRHHIGDDVLVGEITSEMLSGYRAAVMAKDWSLKYRDDHTQVIGQFFNWLYENEHIGERPRLLTSNKWRVSVELEEPEPATIEECQQVLLAGNERVRLFALLMLNCGFTQVDIGDLKQSEVDWKKGIITRKRSKTRKKKTKNSKPSRIPKISFQLWPETFSLLKKYRSTDPERVLLSESGTPLWQESLKGQAKSSKTDLVRQTWVRMQKKTGITISPKQLRKAGPNELNKHPQYKMFHYDLLGNVPEGIAAQHYIQFDQAGFAKALAWLRTKIIPKQLRQ
jgi:integrase